MDNYRSFLFISCFLFLAPYASDAQESKKPKPFEFSAGLGGLFYQSSYGFDNTLGIEVVVGRSIRQPVKWEAGFRLGLDPLRPDIFLRLIATQRFGSWKPSIGLENGFTDRAYFEGDSDLLKETREAMTKETGKFYCSVHTELLTFGLKNNWDIGFAEMDFGTHYKNFGSTLRLNLNFLSLSKSF